jgi:hypothetical protein
MLSRSLAVVAAASLALTPAPLLAQGDNRTPTRDLSMGQDKGGSDLLLIFAAIVAAGLVTFLATSIGGDKPASP